MTTSRQEVYIVVIRDWGANRSVTTVYGNQPDLSKMREKIAHLKRNLEEGK
jgi:hypothetical protein